MLRRRFVGGQRMSYERNKRSNGMKRSVRINLRREGCGSRGRQVGTKINIWMQNRKHDLPSAQLREMQKRKSLLVLKTVKKTSSVWPKKYIQKSRM